MFPSTGHFRFMPCPFHAEGYCGRVYCHFRHVKSGNEKAKDDAELLKLEKEICNALKIDKETFNILTNEEDENVHEKLVNNKLKSKFPGQEELIDDFRFPESSDDLEFSAASFPSNDETEEMINLTNEQPLDEGPLKQFLEEDAKQNTNSEHRNRNTIEKRHIIISCLEKIDKRENARRPIVQPKPSHASVGKSAVTDAYIPENTDDIATQPLFSEDLRCNLKQEASDSSESEDNSEVDKILTQMELLNPELFSTDKVDPFKNEPIPGEVEDAGVSNELSHHLSSQATIPFPTKQDSSFKSSVHPENRIGRINLKSIAAINNEFSTNDGSLISKPERSYSPANTLASRPAPDSIVFAAAIAEQNRLKSVFKSTICSNVDQFFDMSDACKVYGTEIFNLLEPLLNFLIEKLNPEFNYQKLRQLHTQNMSLSCALPFVTTCDHAKNCIECHNLLLSALSRNKVKTANETTETDSTIGSDTPLRKIEAGLYDITKEMLSLGIPVDHHIVPKVATETKSVQCQASTKSDKHSSHRHDKDKHNSSSKSRSRHESRKHSSSSSRHSRNNRHSSKSSNSSHRREKRRKTDESEDGSSEDEHDASTHRRSSKSEYSRRKKRPSSDKIGHVVEKKLKTVEKKSDNEKEIESDIEEDLFGAPLSDGYSDSESAGETRSAVNEKRKSVSQDSSNNDSEDELTRNARNSDEFVDPYPTTTNKKRISHVTENNSSQVYRKPVTKKHIPTPAEAMYQRVQGAAGSLFSTAGSAGEKVRISHVPNVALILKAKEQIKHCIPIYKPNTPAVRTTVQTAHRGQRVAHVPAEPAIPKDVPIQAHLTRPTITEFKSSHNIPLHIRQVGLDKLYNAFAKKVPPEIAGSLALKEEQTIHEKVTIQKVYQNSLAMAVHRIAKENPAKLLEKTSDFPLEINGFSIYDLLSKHILTFEQLEINGFPLAHPSEPGCCRISTKAIHYKPLLVKRSGDRFYCQQCKELFEIDPETGLPITPITGCRFHPMRPRKERGRTRHELYYPCCNSGISESGCMSAEYHTPDTTDDDCLEGFLETRDPPPGERGTKRIYSLDCEMCATTEGAELTRVTVIGHDCNSVYDSLVKPRNPILDYNTKFSGITEEKLRRVTKTLEQVREELFKFIFKDSILIGHSLENDLKALKILHYKIVDTSVMYPHRDAPERKFSLKNLSANIVQFLIQESEFGHDSKEDALACMKLVWKKIREDAQVFRPKKIISSPAKSLS